MKRWRRLNPEISPLERLEPRQLLAADGIPAPEPVEFVEAAAAAQEATGLRMIVRDSYLSGVPILVRLQAEDSQGIVDREVWDATVSLSSSHPAVTLSTSEVSLVNGMGSALVTVQGTEAFSLTADWNGFQIVRQLVPLVDPPIQELSGTLTDEVTTLSGVVHITDDLTVPEGRVLQLEPGTLVLVSGVPQTPRVELGTQIIVQGSLNALGTEDQPVTITAADPARPWSELDVQGGQVNLQFAEITQAGTSPRGGHTNTGPAIRLQRDGSVRMSDSSVTDIRGKIMQATSGSIQMTNVLLSRAVMGPEIERTSLEFRDSWIVDMAGRFHHNGAVDDNDGIYLHTQASGQRIELIGSVVAQVQDDAIDTLNSVVTIEDTIVRQADDKAISVFDGDVTVLHCLLVDSDIGIETKGAGTSRPRTTIDRTTIANITGRGISVYDKGTPDPNVVISLNMTNSIIHVLDGGDPVLTDYDPADLHINYSSLSEPWNPPGSGTGNLDAQPLFVDAAANNYRLDPNSPAIDAGDPTAGPDPDGTRIEMGYFSYEQQLSLVGDLNHDGIVDAEDIDLLALAIRQGMTAPQFDLNDNGLVNDSDFQYLIQEILQTTAGDANLDGFFNSTDMVEVFQSGEYEDDLEGNSGWCAATGTATEILPPPTWSSPFRPAAMNSRRPLLRHPGPEGCGRPSTRFGRSGKKRVAGAADSNRRRGLRAGTSRTIRQRVVSGALRRVFSPNATRMPEEPATFCSKAANGITPCGSPIDAQLELLACICSVGCRTRRSRFSGAIC